ncbi:glycosyltransferase [Cellulomonas sp. CW35]|uniref:glycosyltransferase n=1 Tax=Cellulomonas sp. CW35 TaxID=3458249 RepID=UPI004033FFB7
MILVPPAVCALEEVYAVTGTGPNVLVTDRFVPALAASRLADVLVGHGGQGTVQTTMAAGTPLIGVGTVLEQQVNLEHVMDAGAGLRIQQHRWCAPVIRRAVRTVLADPAYRRNAQAMATAIGDMDGAGTAAQRIWEFLCAG